MIHRHADPYIRNETKLSENIRKSYNTKKEISSKKIEKISFKNIVIKIEKQKKLYFYIKAKKENKLTTTTKVSLFEETI